MHRQPAFHLAISFTFVAAMASAAHAQTVPATQPAPPAPEDREAPAQGPRSLGVMLDSDGHVLVPYFVEKEVVGDQALKVFLSPGHVATARFVGSDQKTNLTLLKLDKPGGKPIAMLGRRPPLGAMVMVLLTSGEAGQLLI